MIAILPAAGLGTRMLRVTGGGPKELLPICGRPLVVWAIDEGLSSGASDVVVVISPRKPEIEELGKAVGDRVSVAHQSEPRGLADAIARGATRRGDALVILPDTIFHPESPSRRLVERFRAGADAVIAVHTVERSVVGRYGIFEVDAETGIAARAIEKPRPGDTTSSLAVAARYVLSSALMDLLRERLTTHPAETDLMSLFTAAIAKGMTVATVPLTDREFRLDCGSPEGYARAVELLGP